MEADDGPGIGAGTTADGGRWAGAGAGCEAG